MFLGTTSSVRSCDVDASGRFLISGGKDATVRCFDVKTGEIVWFYDGHTDYLNRVLVSGEWARLLSGKIIVRKS